MATRSGGLVSAAEPALAENKDRPITRATESSNRDIGAPKKQKDDSTSPVQEQSPTTLGERPQVP